MLQISFVLVLVDDRLYSCSAVDAHIFPVSIQSVLESIDGCHNHLWHYVLLIHNALAEAVLSNCCRHLGLNNFSEPVCRILVIGSRVNWVSRVRVRLCAKIRTRFLG